MNAASVIFLPWVRQGLAAHLSMPDPIDVPLQPPPALRLSLGINEVDATSVSLRLHGPADVIGLDPRQIVRTEPPAGSDRHEAGDLVMIEFDNPDLPWLFTPARADGRGRLRPWLVLVVVRVQDGVRVRPPLTEPLPVLEINAPAVPADELPDLAESWAWAHAQLAWSEGSSPDDLRHVLATRPELSVARLLSPRLLMPDTRYLACVVPAFEVGRRAGLGETSDTHNTLEPAWHFGTSAPSHVTLPVYHHWEFRTGERENFRSIVARLHRPPLTESFGRRPMDINTPGFRLPPTSPTANPLPPVMLEGALQAATTSGMAPRAVFPDQQTRPWQQALLSILHRADTPGPDTEPLLTPPIYGHAHADRRLVGEQTTPTWLEELNLDPRERVAAALGTRVIQTRQDELMARAWDQVGQMAEANQLIRQMQLSLTVTKRLYTRHVLRINDDALWRLAAPAQARLVLGSTPDAAPVTMQSLLTTTRALPTSAPMRRLIRASGPLERRALRVLRVADPLALSATRRTTELFRLHIPLISLPPSSDTSGLVSIEAINALVPPEQQIITLVRGSPVAGRTIPPRPGFIISGEPLRLIFRPINPDIRVPPVLTRSATGTTRAKAAPRGQPIQLERPLPLPPRPLPPRPIPPTAPLPPASDSTDAAAFRAAMTRHLRLISPALAIRTAAPPELAELDTAPLRKKMQEQLDPAPSMLRRLQTLVTPEDEPHPSGAPLPAITPLGQAPVFSDPVSEWLADLSQDWLLPGLDQVPADSVMLLTPNQRFIEAFMVGLNVEMGRELLWRDFAVPDPCTTFFSHFWRTQGTSVGDISAIADWGTHQLGENQHSDAARIPCVLLLRSVLFRRYPNAIIHAVPARRGVDGRTPGPIEQEIPPLFTGTLSPDLNFFGFDLDIQDAITDPGWYFVIRQQPTEPRFGFDTDAPVGQTTHVRLEQPPSGHAMPSGTVWAFNAAHMAQITRRQPVCIAIHASELLAAGNASSNPPGNP